MAMFMVAYGLKARQINLPACLLYCSVAAVIPLVQE
jgi:hypothetical protein